MIGMNGVHRSSDESIKRCPLFRRPVRGPAQPRRTPDGDAATGAVRALGQDRCERRRPSCRRRWSPRSGSNRRPPVYKTGALAS